MFTMIASYLFSPWEGFVWNSGGEGLGEIVDVPKETIRPKLPNFSDQIFFCGD